MPNVCTFREGLETIKHNRQLRASTYRYQTNELTVHSNPKKTGDVPATAFTANSQLLAARRLTEFTLREHRYPRSR